MPGNLDQLTHRLRTWYEPAKLPYEIYNPTKPQLIRINKPNIYVSGVIGGGKFSTDAIGIASPNDAETRITIVDGSPVYTASEQKREFATTSQLAKQISESPLGTWPKKSQNIAFRGSITTDIYSINNGNYLVGSIGSMDNSAFAFVPNSMGNFDKDSFRLIYANPSVDPQKSTIDPTTGDTNRKIKPNPLILPKGSLVLSSTYGGLNELAEMYGMEKSYVLDRPDELKTREEMERAFRSFFRPITRNLERCGPQIINEITRQIQERQRHANEMDIGLIFAHLDNRISVPRKFLPVGKEFLLMNELELKDFDRKLTPDPYSTQIQKYGVQQIRDLIDHLILNDLVDTQVFANANSLLTVENLSPFTQAWLEEHGASVERLKTKNHLDGLSTTPAKSAKNFLLDQNNEAIRGLRGRYYPIDGYGQQFDESIHRERTYSLEFHNLLKMNIPEWLQERKERGLPSNVIDIMGQGLIEGIEKADSVTGVALSHSAHHPHPNSNFIRGNVYHPRIWKTIENRAQEMGGFDIAFCRPIKPFDLRIESYDYKNQADGQLLILKSLLERTYKLMSAREGTILFTLPKFSTPQLPSDVAIKAQIYVNAAMMRYFEELAASGFDVVPDKTALDITEMGGATRDVYKIIKHSTSPPTLKVKAHAP